MTDKQAVRLAAVGDLHIRKASQGVLQPVLASVNERADVLLLCGDLTDYGLPEEAQVLARELTSAVRIPMIAVLGNHDLESNQQVEVCRILADAGVKLLDGDTCEVKGVGFAGAKGFAGGFGRATLGPWGERAIKAFVQEAIDETLKFESALARLRTRRRVALLHYAPVRATVEGEPPEIFPWLGSSRLEEPLNRYPVDVVFHGHAHSGSAEGRTSTGVRVFNVALPLLRTLYPAEPPVRFFELPQDPAPAAPQLEGSLGHIAV
jgi:Icc-related predicted phosphoesterase